MRFTNVALLQHVVGRGPGVRRHIPPLLFLLGFAALLVSLARPQAVLAVPRDEALKTWESLTGRTATIFHSYHKGDEQFPTKAEIAMANEALVGNISSPRW